MNPGRPKKDKADRAVVISITIPPALLEWVNGQEGKNTSERIRIILEEKRNGENRIEV